MLADFPLQMRQGLELLVGQVHEFLGHLLFEIEFRVKLLQGTDRLLECLHFPRIATGRTVQDLRILLANAPTQFLDLLAKPREHFHIALPAFDFLVENDPVETLAAFR
jgi:hypothetical protein